MREEIYNRCEERREKYMKVNKDVIFHDVGLTFVVSVCVRGGN